MIPRDKKCSDLSFWDGSFRRRYIPKFNDLSSHSSQSQDESDAPKQVEHKTKAGHGYLSDSAPINFKKQPSIPSSGGEETKATRSYRIEYKEVQSSQNEQKTTQKRITASKSTVMYVKKENEEVEISKSKQYVITYEPKVEQKLPEKSASEKPKQKSEKISKVTEASRSNSESSNKNTTGSQNKKKPHNQATIVYVVKKDADASNSQ